MLTIVDKQTFENTNVPYILDAGWRMLGIIQMEDGTKYKISWDSTLIKPEVKIVNIKGADFLTVGIDLYFAVIELPSGALKKVFQMDSFFYYSEIRDGCIWIISELDIIVYEPVRDKDKRIGLPDIFVEMHLEGQMVNITCMEGYSVELPFDEFRLK